MVIGLIDVSSAQQIIEAANAAPSVTVAFEYDVMFAGFVSPAVVFGKKVNEQFAVFARHVWVQENFTRLFVEIVLDESVRFS